MGQFIHIRSSQFPPRPGELESAVNPGIYGQALAEYLQDQLRSRGYDAPLVCAEDWGWWVELRGAPFPFGVCIYSGPPDVAPSEFVCTDGATGARKWSWRRFRFVDTTPWTEQLHRDLLAIFADGSEIEVVSMEDEFPDLWPVASEPA